MATVAGKRIRTPTVLQMEAVECGAAALAIILSYLGRIVPLEDLRVSCGVSRDGSKASNLLKAAKEHGLAVVIPGLVLPTFSRVVVDGVLIGGKVNWMGALLAGMILTGLLEAALVWLQGKYLLRLETKLAITSSSKFFWHILHLPIEFF